MNRSRPLAAKIARVTWGDPTASRVIKNSVKTSTPLLIEKVLSAQQCQRVHKMVLDYGPNEMLEAYDGENIVSWERNEWSEYAIPVSDLFDKPHCNLQTRLPFGLGLLEDFSDGDMKELLGGRPINEDASIVFVTAANIRTPLHSDERHGMLLHISGDKNFVVIPAKDSDRDRATLKELLKLRDTCGTHEEIYYQQKKGALQEVQVLNGKLLPGDAIFLPQRNLHDIESTTPTISVSLRFGKWDKSKN